MNKIYSTVSLMLLTMTLQSISGNSLAEFERAHNKANKEYQDAVAAKDQARREGYYLPNARPASAAYQLTQDIDRRVDDAKWWYDKTKYDLERAKQAQECVDDAAIAQELQRQEYEKASQLRPQHDAPPSYAQATAHQRNSVEYKVAAASALIEEIKREDYNAAKRLIQKLYKEYNRCWWCS